MRSRADKQSAVRTVGSFAGAQATTTLLGGNTSFDWLIVDAHHVQLRAERAGTGSGRIYTVTIGSADASGNRSAAATSVSVPK
jgi:hypothetical protein